MANVTIKELLDAGVHYGHQTSRWNPKMKPYVYSAKNGIYIINLQKTAALATRAFDYVKNAVANGGHVMFVGTKRQAQECVREEATRCGMPFVNNRWLGGTLTNFKTIKLSVERLKQLEKLRDDKELLDRLGKKEVLTKMRELAKLDKEFCGIKTMKRLPSAIFIIDPKKEKIAVDEGRKLGIPVLAIIDTNCDPDNIDYLIPGNDDALKSIRLISGKIADACLEGAEIAEKTRNTQAQKAQNDEEIQARAEEDQQADSNERVVIKRRNDRN